MPGEVSSGVFTVLLLVAFSQQVDQNEFRTEMSFDVVEHDAVVVVGGKVRSTIVAVSASGNSTNVSAHSISVALPTEYFSA